MRAEHTYRISKPSRTLSKSIKASRLSLLLSMLVDEFPTTSTSTSTSTSTVSSSSISSGGGSGCTMHMPAEEYSRPYCLSSRYEEDASSPRIRRPSISSMHSCEGLSPDQTRQLWMCMLELQMRYGCYNSTRMDLAVHAGDDAVDLMPNPFILDTLNDSVVDLPEEGWEMLTRHLRHDEA